MFKFFLVDILRFKEKLLISMSYIDGAVNAELRLSPTILFQPIEF
jgi:hypothetical protein